MKNVMNDLADYLGKNASINKVYGDPIEASGKTIIPVAQVSFGLGGGQGPGKKDDAQRKEDDIQNGEEEKESGGGGGVLIKPKGVYETSEQGTRYIPIHKTRKLLLAGFVGFAISYIFFRKRKKK